MATGKISKRTVEAIPLPSPGKREHLWDETLKGFGVMVTDKGVRSYLVQYRIGGRGNPTRRVTIGKHGSPWTADKARDRAAELLEQVRRKIDPFDAAQQQVADAKLAKDEAEKARAVASSLAFGMIADRYIQKGTFSKKTGERIKTWKQYEAIVDNDLRPKFGSTALTAISAADISELLDELGERAPTAARMGYVVLSNIFNFAVEKEKRHFKKADNPMGEVESPPTAGQRDRHLSDDELRLAWHAAGTLGWPWCEIYRLLILTGQRRSEVAHIPWSELNLAERTWIIPGARTKNGEPTLVPLSDSALEIFSGLPRIKNDHDLVFPSTVGTPLSAFTDNKSRLDAAMLVRARQEAEETAEDPKEVSLKHFRIHDLRRTASVGMQRLKVPREVVDEVLNHKTGTRSGITGVYQVYRYQAEKMDALQRWDGLVNGIVGGSIIRLGDRRQGDMRG